MFLKNKDERDYEDIRLVQQCWTSRYAALEWHLQRWGQCKDCSLGLCPKVQRRVFYRGYLPSDILFIGEAPTRAEDSAGFPFLSQHGRILDRVIWEIGYRIDPAQSDSTICYRWCITNAVLCFPYDDNKERGVRLPAMDELKACSERLGHFISICSPSVIVCMGKTAQSAFSKVANVYKRNITFSPESTELNCEPFTPRVVNIMAPSGMLSAADPELEIKRAVLHVVDSVKDLYQRI